MVALDTLEYKSPLHLSLTSLLGLSLLICKMRGDPSCCLWGSFRDPLRYARTSQAFSNWRPLLHW